MKITGKIIELKETQQVSETFRKRNFVVEYVENVQYPEFISFELIQDKCEILDSFQVGQNVEVSFNLRGRKWTAPTGETKYFNSLQAWRIEPATATGQALTQPTPMEGSTTPASNNTEDDLPF
jgi:hypothetical protein